MIRSSLTRKVTFAAFIILVLIISAIVGTSSVIASIYQSIEHLTHHTAERVARANAASSYLSLALTEAHAAATSGSSAKIAIARVYLAAASHELTLMSERETHSLTPEILHEETMLRQHYTRLIDETETLLLSLENALLENNRKAIITHTASLVALLGRSRQLADATSALALKEFREAETVLLFRVSTANLTLGGANAVLILTTATALFLLRRHVVQPLEALAAAAQAMSEQRSAAPLRVTSHDEIGRLQRAFNEMTEALAQQTRRLEEQVAVAEAARAEAETARMHLQEKLATIEEQREIIRAMSVPLLPLTRTSAVVPLIGAIDSARLAALSDQVLQSVADKHFQHVLFDITGVPVVDEEVAHGLLKIVRALRLLGAHAVLVGIRPEVAQALAPLSDALAGVTTYSTLEQGIESVLNVRIRQSGA
ncbi:MAG: HAMP domain-containing protein [Roseiflexus sp.]|nr:HAMP domain-containing protein [Roseiflexus sp.]MCS7288351.1 HAMP domain-containing protein [Roseiflexus sp.]MDW8146501.1 HAMP domain-containing protein [Roseiflexaceae bacterium]MDW8231220.1 HAMP domain-containing protein [Roseiflexaceae bacterium]